jgi:hypothetical protein
LLQRERIDYSPKEKENFKNSKIRKKTNKGIKEKRMEGKK